MKRIPLGEFQKNCPDILESVQLTRKPVLITKRQKPLVKIIPVKPVPAQKLFDRLKGKVKIVGDIESPIWFSTQRIDYHSSFLTSGIAAVREEMQ